MQIRTFVPLSGTAPPIAVMMLEIKWARLLQRQFHFATSSLFFTPSVLFLRNFPHLLEASHAGSCGKSEALAGRRRREAYHGSQTQELCSLSSAYSDTSLCYRLNSLVVPELYLCLASRVSTKTSRIQQIFRSLGTWSACLLCTSAMNRSVSDSSQTLSSLPVQRTDRSLLRTNSVQ